MDNKQADLFAIIGLGATGLSCARFLKKHEQSFIIIDTRDNPPNLEAVKNEFPELDIIVGKLHADMFAKVTTLVLSPGISLKEKVIIDQLAKGKRVVGDIELFAQAVNAPVIAITGTNAKSTVTTLLGEMAKDAGVNVRVGGNLGTPALDLLDAKNTELYILELSSFQLETTHTLAPQVSTVLNVTPDHMDRYDNFEDYRLSKFRIYSDCQIAVCNRDDPNTDCGDQYHQRKLYFTLDTPGKDEFGLLQNNEQNYLAYEDKLLMPVSELPILGRHYQSNALATLALGYGYGLSFESMLKTLRRFKGLPHRCQLIRIRNGVRWYNDSKGTNVGATLAAIEGLGAEIEGKIVLIAGGVGKNADFTPLLPAMEKYVKAVVLIGEAAPLLAAVMNNKIINYFASSMDDAISICEKIASSQDSVLLSPACASLDMFKNFEHRGQIFTEIVEQLN